MSTKHNSKCLTNAADQEPIFVLRGQDRLAPQFVRQWAAAAKATLSDEKYNAALACADAMEKWPNRKLPD